MHIKERQPGDRTELDERIRSERSAKQHDRLRAARLALDGQTTEAIMTTLGRSRGFVQDWAYAYRDGGLDAISVKKQPGRPCKLTLEQQQQLKNRIDAGPTGGDGVCTLRGADVRRILQIEFGVAYSLRGSYELLHALGYSCLRPRPRHEQNDPAAMEAWKQSAPLLSSTYATNTRTRPSRSGLRTKQGSGRREH
jgi:putative transposase